MCLSFFLCLKDLKDLSLIPAAAGDDCSKNNKEKHLKRNSLTF